MDEHIRRAPAPPVRAGAERKRPRVVVVGGGFGGLEVAKGLAGADVDVVLIDRENHHCFQPLLYQVATAALNPADVAWPVRRILRGQANVTVLMAEVTGVDTAGRVVVADGEQVAYDYLVLATGSTHSYFGHPEWAEVAPGLKRIDDATDIRRRILEAFERAELTHDDAERQRLMTFIVVGGGPTGVELAGALHELARLAMPLDFRRIDPRQARIILVEAGPRLLPTLPEHLSDYALATLQRMGVEVRTGAAVTACDAAGVELGEVCIPGGTLLWAAGVKASPAAQWLGLEGDKAGRVKVAPDLTVPGQGEVFVIGDTASVKVGDQPVPGIAPAAKQMGAYVARVIRARVAGAAAPGPFEYRHQGDLATIGRKSAVVKLGRTELTGFAGWLFWSVVHIYFLVGARHRIAVAFAWMWNYVTFQRDARLIVARERPGARHDPQMPSALTPDGRPKSLTDNDFSTRTGPPPPGAPHPKPASGEGLGAPAQGPQGTGERERSPP